MNRFKLISFDLDDTVWPVEPVIVAAERAYLDHLAEHEADFYALHAEDDIRRFRWQLLERKPDYQHHISDWRRDALALQLEAFGYSAERARRSSEAAFTVFHKHRQQVSPFDDAVSVLESLAEQYTLAAISNGNALLSEIAFGSLFSIVLKAEDVGESKPGLAMFHQALQQAGCSAAECLHIGDCERNDVAPAKSLGMASGLARILPASKDEELPASAADFSFTQWQQLPAKISELEKESLA